MNTVCTKSEIRNLKIVFKRVYYDSLILSKFLFKYGITSTRTSMITRQVRLYVLRSFVYERGAR